MALTTNLVAYWKLDESSGNASDSVGSYTLTNNNSVSYATGKINNGADYGSSNTTKSLSTTNNFGINGSSMTFAGWIKVSSQPPTNDNNRIFTQVSTVSAKVTQTILYRDSGGTKNLYVDRLRQNVANDAFTYNVTLTTGTWYHIAYTYNRSTVTGYLNGSSIGTASSSGDGNNPAGWVEGFYLRSVSATGNCWSGMFDEVGVWSRALSSTEISELYNSGSGLSYPFVNSYTLTAGTGSFTLTGIAATISKGIGLTADSGSFTLTGIDVIITSQRNLAAGIGSFILTGQDAMFFVGIPYTMSTTVGEFLLTGKDANIYPTPHLNAATGAFTLTGSAAKLISSTWSPSHRNTSSWGNTNKSSINWINTQ